MVPSILAQADAAIAKKEDGEFENYVLGDIIADPQTAVDTLEGNGWKKKYPFLDNGKRTKLLKPSRN
jgi:hypothetical protein